MSHINVFLPTYPIAPRNSSRTGKIKIGISVFLCFALFSFGDGIVQLISFKTTVSNSLNRALNISSFNSILKLYRLILKTVRPEHISKMKGISRH